VAEDLLTLDVLRKPILQPWPLPSERLVRDLYLCVVAGDETGRDQLLDEPLVRRVERDLAARTLACTGSPSVDGMTSRRNRART
jgi:hypothetical protein